MMEFTLREIIESIGAGRLYDDDILDGISCLLDMIDEGATLAKVVRIVKNRCIDIRDD